MKNCKGRMTNLSVAWIDYKKAYTMVPHIWILHCLKIFKVDDNIRNLIGKSMKNWKVELVSGGEPLCDVKIEASFKETVYCRTFDFLVCTA